MSGAYQPSRLNFNAFTLNRNLEFHYPVILKGVKECYLVGELPRLVTS